MTDMDTLIERLGRHANRIDGHMAGADGLLDMGLIEADLRSAVTALQQALAERDEAQERTAKLLTERQDLDKRIRRQRRQLRDNWVIFEQRSGFVYRYRMMKPLVDRTLEALLNYARKLRATEAEITRLTAALSEETEACATLIEEGFERAVGEPYRNDGKPSKNDKCPHDRYMYEDCEACCAAAIRSRKDKP